MATITCVLTTKEIEELRLKFNGGDFKKTPPYAQYQVKGIDCVITAYNSKKVVFQGDNAEAYASNYTKTTKSSQTKVNIKNTKSTSNNTNLDKTFPMGGSDEVGTGDYFGPVCVCAAIVDEDNYKELVELGVNDSKVVNDKLILKIAPILMKKLKYSLLILDNNKYNKIHESNNLNKIKALLHNKAYINLSDKVDKMPTLCIVDQFAAKDLYYRYLNTESNIYTDLHFETKAESKYIAVAAASIIARYAFLTCMDNLSDKYGCTFPKGANSAVDSFAQHFIDEHSYQELNNVAKLHFKNTEYLKIK
ncbi:MAG: ribonuclease HIII [Erysipelotrichaceae bacterium]